MSRPVINPKLSPWLEGKSTSPPKWGFRVHVPPSAALFAFLTILTSLLYVLAFPRFNFFFLAWIALVPLAYVAVDLTPRQALFTGWLAGTLAYTGLLYWIIVTFQAAGQSLWLAAPCLLALSAYLGLYWGVWTWLLSRFKAEGESLLPLWAAAAWVGLEYVRTHLFSGFPWALLGDSQWQRLSVIQVASLTGVYGVSFLIVLMNAAIVQALRKRTLAPVWAGLLIAACVMYGGNRLQHYDREARQRSFKVALLQGNVDQYQKWDQHYETSIQQRYERLTAQAAREKPALIIWPETSVPGYLLQSPTLFKWLTGVIRKSGTSHVVGAPSMDGGSTSYNTAFSLDPQGRIVGRYDKQHLVPFGEIVPWADVLDRWIKVLNALGGFTAGHRSPVVPSAIGPLGVNICYEAIFPDLVRRSARDGARMIVNLTNDGWYMHTAAPYQHFTPHVFRAVENDRWVLRADNTGITGLINPRGRVVAASSIFTSTIVTGSVVPRQELTFYSRYGDVFAWGCLGFCIFFWLRAILRRR